MVCIDNVCIDNIYLIIITLLIFTILVCMLVRHYILNNRLKQIIEIERIKRTQPIEEPVYDTPPIPAIPPVIPEPLDRFRQYDYRKMYDPLEQPFSRPERYDIPPRAMPYYFYEYTRGYPDTFQLLGILKKEGESKPNDNNKILKLYGRPQYPHSDMWDYYTSLNVANDQIKVTVDKKHRQLYDDDVVNVNELDSKYKVKLYKVDSIKYNPYIEF